MIQSTDQPLPKRVGYNSKNASLGLHGRLAKQVIGLLWETVAWHAAPFFPRNPQDFLTGFEPLTNRAVAH